MPPKAVRRQNASSFVVIMSHRSAQAPANQQKIVAHRGRLRPAPEGSRRFNMPSTKICSIARFQDLVLECKGSSVAGKQAGEGSLPRDDDDGAVTMK